MNKIEQLTSLLSLLENGDSKEVSKNAFFDRYTGKYVIVRSKNEGVNAGKVLLASKDGVILADCKRLWYHKPKDPSVVWYEGVAETGLSGDRQTSHPVEEKAIIEDYSITICTSDAEKSIRDHAGKSQ